MRYEENQCVGCDLPCIGDACSYRHVVCVDCDFCGVPADCTIEDNDLCTECAKKYLIDICSDMYLDDLAKALDIHITPIND